MKKKCFLFFAVLCFSFSIHSKVIVPAIFADNMVLQRNTLIPVWGWAGANEKVEVKFNKQTKTIKADKNGKWMIRLDAEAAGGPYELSVKGKNIILIKNVLVGEVWLCSGQSNMEWTVAQSMNAKKEIAAGNYPFIRHIKILHSISSLPESDFKTTGWKICDAATVGEFTGVGYFFAKRIYDSLKIPIGLINDSWGGTNIETWISREGFESSDEYKEMIAGMPLINLDSLSKLKVRSSELRIEQLQGTKLKDLNTGLFKELSFDDSKWPELNAPQLWEQQSPGELDGVVWLRKTITLSEPDSKKNAILQLAKIDDDDMTYVNGVKVGSTNQWDAKRKYAVPPGILKEGKNVIAVRVVDNVGGGGIYGDTADLKLSLGNSFIPLKGNWKFQVESVKKTTNENSLPSLCYNAMINPLIPFTFKGVLWYQGESNAERSYQYRKAFPLLINDWRQKWNNPNMPFYFVQLATFFAGGNSNVGCGWAELREAQTMTLNLPNTGMCVTTDLVTDPKDIHPTNKQDVGKRLAAIALNNLYNKKMICSGPTYKSMEVKGNEIILSFYNFGSGLFTPDKYGYLKGFEVAGADSVFHFAKAYIKDNKIILSSEKVSDPMAAHFGWMGDAGECNLFNKEGFPAVPFRTDEWKTATLHEKYKIEKLK
ncbi:MAG: beta galactosidase jelly roll domain-containing protein [Sphingobacteriales bacterium]|nr:beta galactosidase jelly roll domain-containing protein [Sphingobacteriales bacterium]